MKRSKWLYNTILKECKTNSYDTKLGVVGMINENQVLTNVLTCLSCGIEKVFIINHQTTSEDLIKCARRVKDTYPNLWVGINESLEDVNSHVNESSYKGLHYGDITDLSISIKGKPNSEQSTLFAEISNKFKNSKLMHSASHIHITFDNEKDKSNAIDMLKDDNVQFINESLEDVNSHVNESTTSGPGTGKAADINKILDLRKNLGEHPMAIASGVNIENIDTYKGIVDYLLVASSITSRSEIIYEDKLLDLISKLK